MNQCQNPDKSCSPYCFHCYSKTPDTINLRKEGRAYFCSQPEVADPRGREVWRQQEAAGQTEPAV